MRSAVADYELLDDLGGGRYGARAPARLSTEAPGSGRVTVTELEIGSAGWAELTSSLSRYASVRSPHLLRLLEVGPDMDAAGAGVYLVTEEVKDGTLGAPTASVGIVDKVRAVANAALGAHALHEAGIVHGAISPGAVLLLERGAVLGPAEAAEPAGQIAAMRDWRDLSLIDPDLLRGQPPSRSSDIWALAATLYLVAGPAPLYPGIEDDKPVTAVQRVMFSRPEISPSTPGGLGEVLGSCFDADPAGRPETASDLADRLLACEASL